MKLKTASVFRILYPIGVRILSKKLLLTGATGLLGCKLYPYLKEQGFCVIGHGYTTTADVNCDLCCKQSTEQLLDIVRPQLIINLVALTSVVKCEENPQNAYLLNVKTLENIVAWIKEHPDVQLIHLSTDQMYDGPGEHKEDDIALLNTYAFSKYCAELVARQVRSTVLRTNFFGHSRLPRKKSFSDWLINSFEEQVPIKLFTDIFFSPLSFDTLQEIIVKIIKKPVPGVFNLGSRDGMSKRDFGMALARHFSLKTDNAQTALSSEFGFKARRPCDMRMNCDYFERTFSISLPSLIGEIKRLKRE